MLRAAEGAESIPIPKMIAFEAERWNWKWFLANLKKLFISFVISLKFISRSCSFSGNKLCFCFKP